MKCYIIDSVRGVQEFFTDLHLRTQSSFSPEDDLETLLDAAGNAVFSKAEAAYFDDIILDCFVFCNDCHPGLHEIVEGLQQELCLAALPEPSGYKSFLHSGALHRPAAMLYPMQRRLL